MSTTLVFLSGFVFGIIAEVIAREIYTAGKKKPKR